MSNIEKYKKEDESIFGDIQDCLDLTEKFISGKKIDADVLNYNKSKDENNKSDKDVSLAKIELISNNAPVIINAIKEIKIANMQYKATLLRIMVESNDKIEKHRTDHEELKNQLKSLNKRVDNLIEIALKNENLDLVNYALQFNEQIVNLLGKFFMRT